jgi:hypothetical protein
MLWHDSGIVLKTAPVLRAQIRRDTDATQGFIPTDGRNTTDMVRRVTRLETEYPGDFGQIGTNGACEVTVFYKLLSN